MENIFTLFAKGLASFIIERKIGKKMDAIAQDPEVITAIEDMRQAQANIDKLEADYCKRHPDDPKCGEYFRKQETLKNQVGK